MDIFGLFEEMAAGSLAIGGGSAGSTESQQKAAGCNDFAHLANWTRLDFMKSEAHIQKGSAQKKVRRCL